MGIEYTLRFTYPDAASVSAVLRQLPVTHEQSSSAGAFELRSAGNVGGMPDAVTCIEPYGLYYCDNGGSGREFLGLVITRLVGVFRTVTIAPLE
jgi:hypothetical protein